MRRLLCHSPVLPFMRSLCTQNMEYKFIELLSCDFRQSSEEVIRQQMSFRYNALKSKLALMHVSI